MAGPGVPKTTSLLRFLVQNNLLPREVADAAEADPGVRKGEICALEWIGRRGLIEEEELATRLAERLRIPYINLATQALEKDIVSLIREDVATRHRMVAVRQEARTLVVATANPLDREALRAVEFATGRPVRLVIATASALADALARAYHFDATLSAYLEGVPGEGHVRIGAADEEAADLERLRSQTSLPPVVKLLNLVLLDGIRSNASDIHIEATPTEVRVRYRVDGILQEAFQFPKWVLESLVARCKVLAKLDITERQRPQDGRMRIEHRETQVDMRVSSLPTQFGEKVTLRILNAASAPNGLDHLHLSERDHRCVRSAIGRPQGMILVTGPTGSGKTTTLYSMLAELKSSTRNIVTVENPIEYHMPGVNQVEINEKRGLTFADTLRSILRQDPDVILVGEIRDQETAQIAMRAAQTGHLVLSTLHTNDSVATITRLMDLGIEPYALGPSLNLVIAQRLVRRVCERCAVTETPDAAAQRALFLPADATVRRGEGCKACGDIGYSGRAAVLEVTAITPQLTRLIDARAAESVMRQQAYDDGTVPLFRNAIQRILDGTTTPEEVLRAVDLPDEEPRCPACDRPVSDRFAVCPHCATPLRLACQRCQKPLQREWQTCPYCGKSAHRDPVVEIPPPAVIAVDDSRNGGEREPDATRQFTVLVVDDDVDSRRLLTAFLTASGLPVVVSTAKNGVEALACVGREAPDLILLDVMMPEMNGFDVCTQLRANVRTTFIPILMLTALADSESRARGFTAGTDDFVSKPFRRAELLARVRRILQRTYGMQPDRDPPAAMDEPNDPALDDAAPSRLIETTSLLVQD